MAKLKEHTAANQTTKIAFILVAMMLFLASANAQNEGQYSHFMFNRLSYNPAYAGSSGNVSLTALYNNQWMGLDLQAPTADADAGSTPTNYLFSFDMPVRFLHGGIGLIVNAEEIGYHKNITIDIDYAFRIFWGPGNLAAAIEVGLYNYQFNTKNLYGISDLSGDFSSPINSANDPLVSGDDLSDFLFDLSTGIYYQVPGVWYASLSVKNLLGSHSETIKYSNVRSLYLMGGYEYTFPYNPAFKLKPSALVKGSGLKEWQAEAACLLDYEDLFWGGLGYRWRDAFTFLAGVNFNWSDSWLRIGVAYDLTTSKLGTFKPGRSFGSLEAFLNFSFQIENPKKPPTVSRTTRYLL